MLRILAVAMLALTIQSGIASGAESRRCLRYHDLDGITKVDTQTLIAKAKGGGRYKIEVDAKCRYLEWPEDFFVTRQIGLEECVQPGDALVLNHGGNCFVQNVTPMEEPTAH